MNQAHQPPVEPQPGLNSTAMWKPLYDAQAQAQAQQVL